MERAQNNGRWFSTYSSSNHLASSRRFYGLSMGSIECPSGVAGEGAASATGSEEDWESVGVKDECKQKLNYSAMGEAPDGNASARVASAFSPANSCTNGLDRINCGTHAGSGEVAEGSSGFGHGLCKGNTRNGSATAVCVDDTIDSDLDIFIEEETKRGPVDPWAEAERLLACKICGGKVVKRSGKFGIFLGCQMYPRCKGAINVKNMRRLDELIFEAKESSSSKTPFVGLQDRPEVIVEMETPQTIRVRFDSRNSLDTEDPASRFHNFCLGRSLKPLEDSGVSSTSAIGGGLHTKCRRDTCPKTAESDDNDGALLSTQRRGPVFRFSEYNRVVKCLWDCFSSSVNVVRIPVSTLRFFRYSYPSLWQTPPISTQEAVERVRRRLRPEFWTRLLPFQIEGVAFGVRVWGIFIFEFLTLPLDSMYSDLGVSYEPRC
jgi:hypothetical protein